MDGCSVLIMPPQNQSYHQSRIRLRSLFVIIVILCALSNVTNLRRTKNKNDDFQETQILPEPLKPTKLKLEPSSATNAATTTTTLPTTLSNTTSNAISDSAVKVSSSLMNETLYERWEEEETNTVTESPLSAPPSVEAEYFDYDHRYIAPRQTELNNMSTEKSMKIMQNIGTNDLYKGGSLKCVNKGKNGTVSGTKTTTRTPEIYWYDYRRKQASSMQQMLKTYSRNVTITKPSSRLLIVQSAGFGSYGELLDATVPITKAYARRWKATLLVVQGALVILSEEKKQNCVPGEHRSTHNKMQLLKFALRHKHYYDYLLLLDADALIYNFDIDISTALHQQQPDSTNITTAIPSKDIHDPHSKFLAAHRVGGKKDGTWKINAGVTLWNIQHPCLPQLVREWQNAALGYLNARNNNSGDQIFLYHVLKNNATLEAGVLGLDQEFNYNKGTAIKHVKRPKAIYGIGKTKVDERLIKIQKFSQEICEKYPKDCEKLETFHYSQV